MKSLLSFLFYCSFVLFIFSSLTIPVTHAQLGATVTSDDVSADLLPENPGPNTQTTISIDSFVIDLNSIQITWSINGKKVLSGIGQKNLTFTTGNIGQKTTISIVIDAIGGSLTKTITLIPASVNMIWEANTYTPPFFKGKALFSAEGSVTFIALPHIIRNGVEVPANQLVYTWSNNGTVFGSQGGYGKNTLTIAGSIIPRPMDVSVEVSDPQSGSVAKGETTVNPGQPLILLYKNDPLYGVQYEKALSGTFSLSGTEVDMTAVPYYFSINSSTNNSLSYVWEINGTPLSDGINSPTKAFRRVGNTLGSSNVSVSATLNGSLFQNASQSILINFQNTTSQTSL